MGWLDDLYAAHTGTDPTTTVAATPAPAAKSAVDVSAAVDATNPGLAREKPAAPSETSKWLDELTAQQAAPANVSKAESAVRGGLQGATSGFGDELAAGIDTAVSKVPLLRDLAQNLHSDRFPALTNPDVTYAERRNAYRGANAEAETANPLTYLGGNVGGTLAQSAVLPAGGGIARGVAEGAAAGAGYSDAQDLRELGKDAATGGVLGGVVAGTLGKLGKKAVQGAPEREAKDVINIITENEDVKTAAKTAKAARQQAENIADQLRTPENRPILAAAARDPKEAVPLIQQRLGTLKQTVREPAYQELEQITGGARAGDLIKPYEDELSKLSGGGPGGRGVTGKGAEKKYLKNVIDDMKESWSTTVTPEEQLDHIADKVIPPGTATRKAWDAMSVADKQATLSADEFRQQLAPHDVHTLSKPLEPIRVWNPETKITEQEARAHLSGLQKNAKTVWGTLLETPTAERANMVKDLAQRVQNEHLEAAAAQSPRARQVVEAIQSYNKEASALLTTQESLKPIIEKQAASNTKGLAHQIHDKTTAVGAVAAAAAGHPLLGAGIYAGSRWGLPAARAAGRTSNMLLAEIMRQAQAGAPVAQLAQFAIQRGVPDAAAQMLAGRAHSLTTGDQ